MLTVFPLPRSTLLLQVGLTTAPVAVIVCSTTGNGDIPNNAEE
jgi:hypothetical protein